LETLVSTPSAKRKDLPASSEDNSLGLCQNTMRDGAVAARKSHKLQVVGAIPTPATKPLRTIKIMCSVFEKKILLGVLAFIMGMFLLLFYESPRINAERLVYQTEQCMRLGKTLSIETRYSEEYHSCYGKQNGQWFNLSTKSVK
jgi:hypothetical protein